VPVGTDADQGNRTGAGVFEEHGEEGVGRCRAAAVRRPPGGSVVDAVEPRIRELLQACPTMPATVIAERIEWRYSIRTSNGRAAELRPIMLPPDRASRTT
jgi:hypothetical protein